MKISYTVEVEIDAPDGTIIVNDDDDHALAMFHLPDGRYIDLEVKVMHVTNVGMGQTLLQEGNVTHIWRGNRYESEEIHDLRVAETWSLNT